MPVFSDTFDNKGHSEAVTEMTMGNTNHSLVDKTAVVCKSAVVSWEDTTLPSVG